MKWRVSKDWLGSDDGVLRRNQDEWGGLLKFLLLVPSQGVFCVPPMLMAKIRVGIPAALPVW